MVDMAPSPESPPMYTDYADRPLKVGDRVTYIWFLNKRPVLGTAKIALLTRDEACLDNGDASLGSLQVIEGQQVKAYRNKPDRCRFDQLSLRSDLPTDGEEEA